MKSLKEIIEYCKHKECYSNSKKRLHCDYLKKAKKDICFIGIPYIKKGQYYCSRVTK